MSKGAPPGAGRYWAAPLVFALVQAPSAGIRFARMNPVASRISFALTVSVVAALACSASAWAGYALTTATGEITRADASPDWAHGSIAGSVSGLPPTTHHISYARAYVVSNGAVCYPNSLPDPNSEATKLVWESPRGNQNPSFDIPDVPLNVGVSARICLYGVYDYIFVIGGSSERRLLASRFFTVPPPPPPASPPAQEKKSEVTLSRGTALSKAKSALKKRFGKAYKHGKRKRLRCSKQSPARYLCTFSFRYRKKRQDGTVAVAIEPNGSVTTKIKRG
jgi:hypothetical protein